MISAVAFLDLSEFTATFVKTYRAKMRDEGDGIQSLLLRGGESDAPVLKDWGSARALLKRIRNESAPYLGGKQAVLGKVSVTLMKPQAYTQWRISDDAYSEGHIRTVTVMIPSPGLIFHSGMASANLLVGSVTVVDQRLLHSETNFGHNAVAFLCVDLQRPSED